MDVFKKSGQDLKEAHDTVLQLWAYKVPKSGPKDLYIVQRLTMLLHDILQPDVHTCMLVRPECLCATVHLCAVCTLLLHAAFACICADGQVCMCDTCQKAEVYQLMMPHFHYTYQINAEARSGLINAGGLVEKVH